MKFLFSLIFLISCMYIVAQEKKTLPPNAKKVMQDAMKKAKKEKKKIFLKTTASWCGWCHKMEDAMSDKVVAPLLNKHYVIAFLDIQEQEKKKYLENAGGDAVIEQYGGKDQGLPYWVVLDAKGKMIANAKIKEEGQPLDGLEGSNCGCPAEDKEITYFLRVLKNTSILNDDELQIIQKRFEKIKAK